MEVFRAEDVTAAVSGALSLGAIGFDAVKHLVLCRIERRPPRLDCRPTRLARASVKTTKAADYAILTPGEWHDGLSPGSARPPPETAEAADVPAGVRQAGPPCAADGVDHPRYLLGWPTRTADRERRLVERRIRDARFPAVKSLDSFDFTAIPSLNKMLVLELARCEYILGGRTSSLSATAS